MKKREKLTISIPFPAWDGIFKVYAVCDELRRNNKMFDVGVSKTPRRIEMRQGKPVEGFDDVIIIEYWYQHGTYVTASLGGIHDSNYGTGWQLLSIKLKWKDTSYDVTGRGISRSLNREDIEVIELARYLRLHLSDYEGHPNLEEARQRMLLAQAASEEIVESVAVTIRKIYEELGIFLK